MKLLTWTTVIALAAGVATLLIVGVTWPTYDPIAAYTRALNAATVAGVDAPSTAGYAIAPAGFAAGHQIAAIIGGAVLGFGALAALFSLHARAVLGAARA